MAWSEHLIHQNSFSGILMPGTVSNKNALEPPLKFYSGTDGTNSNAPVHATAGWSNYTITLPG